MKINVYTAYGSSKSVRLGKWVRNILEARSFCEWYENKFDEKVNFVICR